jgi:hypothetical protein
MRMFVLKYLLRWYRDKLLLKECTGIISNLVECVDYFLEEISKAEL